MTSVTSNDDATRVDTPAARGGYSSLFLAAISTTPLLKSDFLPEPADLARLRAVSAGVRDAVDATGREIKEVSNIEAVSLGYVSLLKDRHSRGVLRESEGWRLCAAAARNGDLKELKALRADKWPWDARTCAYAAEGGHLRVLQWLRENDCPWDEDTCAYAAAGGHLDVLQWLRENDCPWDWKTCANAARHGHLKVLKLARKNGCPWNWETCLNAAYFGHLHVLKWAREKSLPVGRGDVHVRGGGRPPRGAEVGARERMPVELEDLFVRDQ
jgi:hypothetical protein